MVGGRSVELASSWRMVRAFVLNSPYPTAPFSTLYLFGRGQDIGFQKAIDNSPRKRHHIRFWALSLERAENPMATARFWLNTDRPPHDAEVLWVGAGTRDTGFSLTRLTFQITHATDADTNAERDYIVAELSKNGVIGDVNAHQARQRLARRTRQSLRHRRRDHRGKPGGRSPSPIAGGKPGDPTNVRFKTAARRGAGSPARGFPRCCARPIGRARLAFPRSTNR